MLSKSFLNLDVRTFARILTKIYYNVNTVTWRNETLTRENESDIFQIQIKSAQFILKIYLNKEKYITLKK